MLFDFDFMSDGGTVAHARVDCGAVVLDLGDFLTGEGVATVFDGDFDMIADLFGGDGDSAIFAGALDGGIDK